MRSPSRPPETNQLFTFVMLSVLSLVCWGFAIGLWWYFAYYWYGWSERTFIMTFIALPVPFLAYYFFTGSSGLPDAIRAARPGQPAAPTTAAPPTAPASQAAHPPSAAGRPPMAANGFDEWLVWLGNGERHRGTMVLLIFMFWTILYWSLPTITLTALTFSAWGLLTVFGVIILRALFRPSREVSAPGETKSQPKR